MVKLVLVVVIAELSLLAVPAMAKHVVVRHHFHGGYCGYHEPGNPYSKEGDYMAWSGWRARGGWDDHPRDCYRWYRR
jgi:hypothetical protein